MPDYTHALIVMLVMGGCVLLTRILPVIIFGRSERVPEFILYLGKVIQIGRASCRERV